MTSEAKIGLLLGLAFIFAIAFLINGLPTVTSATNNNKLTANMTRPADNAQALAARERKAINRTKLAETKYRRRNDNSSKPHRTVRFRTALPARSPVAIPTGTARPPGDPKPPPAAQTKGPVMAAPNRPALSGRYFVKKGDSLAVIAKKFYGPKQGNKEINVTRIFQANSATLTSPDEIYEGQKLIIPTLAASAQATSKSDNILSAAIFQKVKSIGRRGLKTNTSQAKKTSQYIVRQGDSLWQIAEKMLGDGTRYREIAGLNTETLDDEDNLAVGIRLKLPPR